MTPINISKRYKKENIDLLYIPNISINDLNNPINFENQCNQRLSTILKLNEISDKNKLNFAITHSEIILEFIIAFANKINPKKWHDTLDIIEKEYFNKKDYCYWVETIIKNNKLKILRFKNKNGIQKNNKYLNNI